MSTTDPAEQTADPDAGRLPYAEGSVWSLQFIRTKPGMTGEYLKSLQGKWKQVMEEAAREKLIVSYRMFLTPFTQQDEWNVMLAVELKNMAALDGITEKLARIGAAAQCRKPRPGEEQEALREVVSTRLVWGVTLR